MRVWSQHEHHQHEHHQPSPLGSLLRPKALHAEAPPRLGGEQHAPVVQPLVPVHVRHHALGVPRPQRPRVHEPARFFQRGLDAPHRVLNAYWSFLTNGIYTTTGEGESTKFRLKLAHHPGTRTTEPRTSRGRSTRRSTERRQKKEPAAKKKKPAVKKEVVNFVGGRIETVARVGGRARPIGTGLAERPLLLRPGVGWAGDLLLDGRTQ